MDYSIPLFVYRIGLLNELQDKNFAKIFSFITFACIDKLRGVYQEK